MTTTVRPPTRNPVPRPPAPDHLVLSDQPLFRRFWYATGFASDVAAGPVARTVLGTALVLWRPDPDGPVRVALDRCAHRDAPLSRGWLTDCHLVCPYHGWEWDAEGKTKRIPQFPDSPHPTKSGLTMVRSTERYGMVWVCLATDAEGGPVTGIPHIPEWDDPQWRRVPEYSWHFDCTAMHLLENNFDPGHVAFVHRNTFGNIDEPELTDTTVVRTPFGLEVTGEVPVASRPGEAGATVRYTVSQLHAPFFGHLKITYPDGLQHVMLKAITPIDDERCFLTQTVLRNDTETERPAADILAFDHEVEGEDRDLLESLPSEYPLAVHLNAHAKADRNSLAIRRMWSELITGEWTPTVG